MSEISQKKKRSVRRLRHRGRESQVVIYLGKQLRFFVNESDWKVLPMAAIIAALVSMVIRKKFFFNMEGSLMGGFALTCVAIWNGCFNSIQAVCRERPIIKREHRSGMHITAYVFAHMIYQLLLCIAQTALTMYVMKITGVQFPEKGFMTPYMILDMGITILLITYAADMMSLFLSSVSHTTTGAMTVMPFVLIFQLVFSGGIIPLPEWSKAMSNYTISNYGIKAITAQSGYNELPMITAWNTLSSMRDNEVGGTVTLGQLQDLLDNPAFEKRRDTEVLKSYTVGEIAEILSQADAKLNLRGIELAHPVTIRSLAEAIRDSAALQPLRELALPSLDGGTGMTVGQIVNDMLNDADMGPILDLETGIDLTLGEVLDALQAEKLVNITRDQAVNPSVTLGDIIDLLKNNEVLARYRDRTLTFKTTVGELFEVFGEENVKQLVQEKTAAASRKPEYERSTKNIIDNWLMLGVFIVLFALLSTIALELIDHDKR